MNNEDEIARLIGICRMKDERIAEAEGDRDKLKKEVERLKAELESVEKRISTAIKSVFN